MPADPSDPPQDNRRDFDPQQLWQSQAKEYDAMTLADIHVQARKFEARIRRRNLIEYIACAVVIAGFAPALIHDDGWMMRAGAALIMLATAFVAWQLHLRGAASPVTDTGEALVAAYKRELSQQRDALRSIAVWYLGPFVPGMALLMAGRWFQFHAPKRLIGIDHAIILLCSIIAALVFVVIWLLNQRGADRLQKRIDEL